MRLVCENCSFEAEYPDTPERDISDVKCGAYKPVGCDSIGTMKEMGK